MDCSDVERGTCICILFLIFGTWFVGAPINLSTPRFHIVWLYSCRFSNHRLVLCRLSTSTLCVWAVSLFYFPKYHSVASALSDFIPSVPNSEKHLEVVGLLPPFTTCFHTTQPDRRCWESPLLSLYTYTCDTCLEPPPLFIDKHTQHVGKNESAMIVATRLVCAPCSVLLLLLLLQLLYCKCYLC